MYTKALLSVFKGRLYDPLGRDGAVERCEVSLQDQNNEAYCRFIIKMVCNQGVTKTYKLTYEAVDVMHALFDRNVAQNRWSMHSGAIREYIEYFGTLAPSESISSTLAPRPSYSTSSLEKTDAAFSRATPKRSRTVRRS